MKPHTLNGVLAGAFLASACLGWPDTNTVTRDLVTDAIPEEAALVLIVEDASRAREDFLRTDLGRFLLDPAVKQFGEHGLRKFSDKLDEIQTAYGFKPSDLWTLFPGKVAVGCVLSHVQGASPSQSDVLPSLFVISSVGDNAEQATKCLRGLSEFFRDQFKTDIAKRDEGFWLASHKDGAACAYGIARGRFLAVLGREAVKVYSRIAAISADSKPGPSSFRLTYQPGQGAFAFVDFERLTTLATEHAGSVDSKREVTQVLQVLGIRNLRYGYWGLEFDKELAAYRTKGKLQFAGPPTGLAGLMGTVPVDRTLLSRVPADANQVSVSSINFGGIIPAIREALGGEAAKELEDGLAGIEATSGVKVEALLKALGPGTVFFSKGPAVGQPLAAMQPIDISLGLEVRDRATVVQTVNRLVELAETYQRAQSSRMFEIEHTTVNDVEIRYLVIQGAPFSAMFSPAWAVTDNSILASLHPRTLIAALGAKEKTIAAEVDFERVWREAAGQGASYLMWKQARFDPSALSSVPMLAAIAVPNFVRARTTAQMNACVQHMRDIQDAKAIQKSNKVTLDELVASGRLTTKPTCPGGGEYAVGGPDDDPSCSLHGGRSSPRQAAQTAKAGNAKVALPDFGQWLQMIDWTFWPASIQAGPSRVDYAYGMKKVDSYECRGLHHPNTPSMASASTVGLLAAIAIPNFVKARTTAQKNACINNLRQLEGAKEQWALESRKPTGTEATMTHLAPFLRKPLQCPAGGVYQVGNVGEHPTCSVQGHEL